MPPKSGRRFSERSCSNEHQDIVAKKSAAATTLNDNHCFVYVLGSAGKGRRLTYVGWTNDLDKRLAKHNAGTGARSTRGRTWVLLHSETLPTKRAAMSREWHLKRDRKFRKQLTLDALDPRGP